MAVATAPPDVFRNKTPRNAEPVLRIYPMPSTDDKPPCPDWRFTAPGDVNALESMPGNDATQQAWSILVRETFAH